MIVYPYKVIECGFYKYGNGVPDFGSLTEFLPGFIDWINKREFISETATYQDSESTVPRTLCLEAFSFPSGEEYGFVLWNEVPKFDEGIGIIPLGSKVGEASVELTETDGDSIPGWPVYVIIVPSDSLLVSLVPDNRRGFRSSGIVQVRRYFREYLKVKSKYAIKQDVAREVRNVDKDILGWSRNGGNPAKNYSIRFRAREIKTQGKLNRIINDYKNIYKLVTSSEISIEIPDEQDRLEKLMNLLFSTELEGYEEDRVSYRAEIDFNPKKLDIEALIGKWEDMVNEGYTNYEIGVRFRGESSKVHWFGKARGVFNYEIDQELRNKTLWRYRDLLRLWYKIKGHVMNTYKDAL